METLVVLSASICVIIAAPALPEDDFQDITTNTTTWPPLTALIRDKKSPQQSADFDKFSNIETSFTHGPDSDSTLQMERSLGFKKPIIIKKKVGYHLYRDSDEEKEFTNSRENCNERVKVKLCDEKQVSNSMRMKSSTIDDVNDHTMSEEEMKRSLIMAKEAIANLERDLKKMDIKQDKKLVGIKTDDPSIDDILHKDIDVARQALEHIHENFGNLDSLSFHGTTLKDADELHDIHVTVSKSEEERIAQWKEAMENIQKNVDIARNIEDSFRNPTQSLSLEDFENFENNNNQAPLEDNDNKLRNKDDFTSTTEHAMEEDMQCNSQVIKIKPKGKDAKGNENLGGEMSASATTLNEHTNEFTDKSDHSSNTHNDDTSQFSKTLPPDNMSNRNTENDLLKTDLLDTTLAHHPSIDMKTVDDKAIKEKLTSNNNFETDMDTAGSNNEIKSTDTRSMLARSDLHKLQAKDELLSNSRVLIDNINNGDINLNGKIGNRFATENGNNFEGINKNTKLDEQFQQDEQLPKSLLTKNENMDNANMEKTFSENSDPSHFHGKSHQNDNFVKKDDQMVKQNSQSFTTAFKPRQNQNNLLTKLPDHISINPQETNNQNSNQRSSETTSNTDETTLVKEADEFNKQNQHRTDTSLTNPNQFTGTMKTSNNFNGMGSRMHQEHVEKQFSTQHTMSFDNRERPSHHRKDHWRFSHENARAAYGPTMGPASTSTGSDTNAVGLFPNANVGACSIPLLLSCTPSVTSGSLAKALPAGYGASAYRTEDDFTFFPNKREIKKFKENSSTKTNQLPLTKKLTAISSDNNQ